MTDKCEYFIKGNKAARDKLNTVVSNVNALGNIRGDDFIHVASTTGGYTFSFDLQKLLSRIPLKTSAAGVSIYRVYCKTGAGTGNTIYCHTENPWPAVWDSTRTYLADSLVCIDGEEVVYVSLLSGTNKDPSTEMTYWAEIDLWDNATIYAQDDYVYGTDGLIYKSLQDDNENNLVTNATYWEQAFLWDSGTTYKEGDGAYGTDDNIYKSLVDGNAGNEPLSNPDKWQLFDKIEVICKIYEGGSNLSYCTPLLEPNDEMKVFQSGDIWYSLTTFSPVCGKEA
jgi:hypothetical protein